MNFEPLLSNSGEFTRETLVSDWTRWLIFILLGLPGSLLTLVLGLGGMKPASAIKWELVHWDQVAVLAVLTVIASFVLSGYIVRIYRGASTPPAFDQWGGLFWDGLRLFVVWLVWMLPALILALLAFASLIGGIAISGGKTNPASMGAVVLMLILLCIALILLLVAVVFGTLGAIRYARAGRVTEGFNYREILETIGRIGWGSYILAFIILCVIGFLFSIVSMVLGFLPYIGWVLVLVISPVISVFSARFLTQVYDAGLPPAIPAEEPAATPIPPV